MRTENKPWNINSSALVIGYSKYWKVSHCYFSTKTSRIIPVSLNIVNPSIQNPNTLSICMMGYKHKGSHLREWRLWDAVIQLALIDFKFHYEKPLGSTVANPIYAWICCNIVAATKGLTEVSASMQSCVSIRAAAIYFMILGNNLCKKHRP